MSIYEILVYTCLCLILVKRKSTNKVIFFIIILVLIFIASFRSLEVGTDTINYYNSFRYAVESQKKEFVFNHFENFFRSYFNYDLFIFFTYSLINLLISYVIYKKSPLPFLSLFLFISIGFYTGSFNVMRQFMAMSLMFLAFYKFEKNENYYVFLSLFLVAFFIHNSSIICLFFIFLKIIKIRSRITILLVAISFIFGFFLTPYLRDLFTTISVVIEGMDYINRFSSYLLYEGGDGTRNLISNLGVNFMFILSLAFATEDTRQAYFFKAYFISIILFNLVGSMYYLTRIYDFFFITQIIVLPIVFNRLKINYKKYMYLFFIVIYGLSVFHFKTMDTDIHPYSVRDNIKLFCIN